jgi:protein-disulfide isomerase
MPIKQVKEKVTSKPVVPAPVVSLPKKDKVVPLLVGAIIVAAFAVGYLYGKVSVYEKLGTGGSQPTPSQQAAAPSQAQAPAAAVSLEKVKTLFADKSNIVFGDPNKKLLFVEFSDPSCPYCHVAAGKNGALNKQVGERFILKEDGGTYVAPVPEMKKLVDQGKAAYVWMFTPGHGSGELATQALYCAKEQNKFWEAHDILMSATGYTLLNETVQNDVKKANLMADALKNVLKASELQNCLESGKYVGRIKSDEALGREFGVNGTPGFFINDKAFAGAYSFTDMQSAVDVALK